MNTTSDWTLWSKERQSAKIAADIRLFDLCGGHIIVVPSKHDHLPSYNPDPYKQRMNGDTQDNLIKES